MKPLHALAVLAGIGAIANCEPEAHAQSTHPKQQETRARVERSLVNLYFWGAGDTSGSRFAGHGTGFVVYGPSKRKWIVTTAHGFWVSDPKNRIVAVTYRLPHMAAPSPSPAFVIDNAHDVAMLSANRLYPLDDIPALEWSDADPEDGHPLLVIGSPSGLGFRDQPGNAKNKPITVREMANQLMVAIDAFKPMKGDLTFIQHDVLIAGGYSGSPVVSLRDGKVVGLQSSTLPDAAFIGFAVHRRHVEGLESALPSDLREPILVSADGALARKSALALPFDANRAVVPLPPAGQAPPPVKVKLGGIEIEAPFIHHGYVERDAREVVEKYVEDKDWYLTEEFGANRMKQLQGLLDRVPVARISNPILGVQVLVPKGYRYSVQATDAPNGILTTFSPDADVAAPYDWPLAIWVSIEPKLFASARTKFQDRLTSIDPRLRYDVPARIRKSPVKFSRFRKDIVNSLVADVVDSRFIDRDLGLRTQRGLDDPDELLIRGDENSPEFNEFVAGSGRWLRTDYASADPAEQLCHQVRICARDPRIFLVHYEYSKRNFDAFDKGRKAADQTHNEYSLIASTVSVQ